MAAQEAGTDYFGLLTKMLETRYLPDQLTQNDNVLLTFVSG